jgi:hypothetical protein
MDLRIARDPNNPASFAWHAYSPNVNTFGHAHSWGNQYGLQGWRPAHDPSQASTQQNLGWAALHGAGVHFGR